MGTCASAPVSSQSTLRVTDVYYYPEQNAKSHRTSKFELVAKGNPVFRRGQSFFLALKTPLRPFDESRDSIKLTFNFGPRPSPLIATQFNLKAEKKPFDRTETSWACRIASHDRNAISIEVNGHYCTSTLLFFLFRYTSIQYFNNFHILLPSNFKWTENTVGPIIPTLKYTRYIFI